MSIYHYCWINILCILPDTEKVISLKKNNYKDDKLSKEWVLDCFDCDVAIRMRCVSHQRADILVYLGLLSVFISDYETHRLDSIIL